MIDGANPAAFLEMHHVIKYPLGTWNLGLKIKPNENIINFCNNYFAGDSVTRKSESGFILYVLVVPVSWQSKEWRNMTL